MRGGWIAGFLAALLAAGSMWFYVDRVLKGYQVADAAAHERPRGNLSDLYPRWLGARELLLHHRNPYLDEVTVEIQKGYYGRPLDPARPNDPKDQQGFAYPVYVVFLLAPLIRFPFPQVQLFFHWFLVLLTGASLWLWLRVLKWQISPVATAACVALTLGCFPSVQGIKLQQLSLVAAALLAGASACVASGLLLLGGGLAALATIKPQLAWPLVVWLLVWALSDWHRRRRFVLGFGLMMLVLLAGAEIILPGWLGMFLEAVGKYHRYTQNQSVMLAPSAISAVFSVAAVVSAAFFLGRSLGKSLGPSPGKLRDEAACSASFGRATALVMALTVLVVPMFAPYNQVLLIPAVLALVLDRQSMTDSSGILRFAYAAAAFALAWQWIASLLLTGAYLLGWRAWAMNAWNLPFFTTFALPVLVFALALLDVRLISSSRAMKQS